MLTTEEIIAKVDQVLSGYRGVDAPIVTYQVTHVNDEPYGEDDDVAD